MEDVPPSYESAVNRDAWEVIAPWISSSDLCSASLVCRRWHSIFAPYLWGNPASHFGTGNDAAYVALTRFKRTLRRARLAVRQLTHTLHLPPALSEIYGGPNPLWLRDVLESLPSLQSLIVSRLPFFDHHSLLALRDSSSVQKPFLSSEDEIPQYKLKLLLAEREPNTTSAGLREALFHFPSLVYLDLSYTSPARDASVLAALADLWDLQVLKLRGVGMRDGEAEILANAIGIRVRLLDLRDNHLTDMAVRSLMQACFLTPDTSPRVSNTNTRQIEDWPVGMAPGPDFFSLDSLRSEELDRELLKQLTHPLTGRLAFEDIPHNGLTHLYIADNNLSVEGLSSLLKSTRLHVLDGGCADTVKTISRTKSPSSSTGDQDEARFPGAEKLVPFLRTYASHNLTYLRVNHAVVTEEILLKDAALQPVSPFELASKEAAVFEAPAPAHYALELPSESDAIFELSAEPDIPRSELPGDCVQFALSPAVNIDLSLKGAEEDPKTIQPKRGDGAFAPEIALIGTTEGMTEQDVDVVREASRSGSSSKTLPTAVQKSSHNTTFRGIKHEDSNNLQNSAVNIEQTSQSPSTLRLGYIKSLLRKRPSNLASSQNTEAPRTDQSIFSRQSSTTYLHPSDLPNLRTLILTGVPTHVPAASSTIAALLRFIIACADEACLAILQAQTNYSLPPGHSRHAAEVQHARSLFALRTIVLEMATSRPSDLPASKGWDHSRAKFNMLKSSTGDRDSEALWSAAENDFSFFSEDGEEKDECGIYQNEPEKYFPKARIDEKMTVDSYDVHRQSSVLSNGISRLDSSPLCSTSTLYPATLRSTPILQSPRNLPLGRNRSPTGAASIRRNETTASAHKTVAPLPSKMPGAVPVSQADHPPPPQAEEDRMVDLVAELAKFRKQKKKEYEDALLKWRIRNTPNNLYSDPNPHNIHNTTAEDVPFIEGHWKGEIKIIRNATPKGRTDVVDMYGNYFEKGYLYP